MKAFDLGLVNPEATATQRLYRLDPPIQVHVESWDDESPLISYEYVVASAVNVMFSGPETLIFPADQDGVVTDWGDLPGSYRGLDQDEAIRRMGYEVVAQ